MKKKLSLKEAVQAGQIVYAMNTEIEGSLALAKSAGLFDTNTSLINNTSLFTHAEDNFLWEWRAFVHSTVIYGLSEKAPAVVLIEYIKTVQEILKSQYSIFDEELGRRFVDEPFQAYVEAVLDKRLTACPQIFFKRYLNIDFSTIEKGKTNKNISMDRNKDKDMSMDRNKDKDMSMDKDMDMSMDKSYKQCIAVISGSMAMLFAASLDAFEKYEYALD